MNAPFGTCWDCGLPALYSVDAADGTGRIACPNDAAALASLGSVIRSLDPKDQED